MRITHNRGFVSRYASVVYWRGAFLYIAYSIAGFLSGTAVLTPLLTAQAMFSDLCDGARCAEWDDAFFEMSRVLGEDVARVILFFSGILLQANWIVWLPILGAIVGIVAARFRFLQILAEAETLFVLSEIAGSVQSPHADTAKVTGKNPWQILVATVLPIVFILGYAALPSLPKLLWDAPRITAIETDQRLGKMRLSFDRDLAAYGSLTVTAFDQPASQKGAQDKPIFLLSEYLEYLDACSGNTLTFDLQVQQQPSIAAPEDPELVPILEPDVVEVPEYGNTTVLSVVADKDVDFGTIRSVSVFATRLGMSLGRPRVNIKVLQDSDLSGVESCW